MHLLLKRIQAARFWKDMTAFRSQGQRHSANCKTNEIPLVYCGKQLEGYTQDRHSGQKKYLVSKWPGSTFGEQLQGPGEGRRSRWGWCLLWVTESAVPCQHVARMLHLRNVSMERLQLLRHCVGDLLSWSPRSWTSLRPPSISGQSVLYGIPNWITFISCWGRMCYHK